METKLTMLNSMAGVDFAESLATHAAWGLDLLDLKDCVFGKGIVDLSDDEARAASDMIERSKMSVHCLSSVLFHPAVELGEAVFAREQLGKVDRLIEIADTLRPTVIRLLAPQTERRSEIGDSVAYLESNHPWVFGQFTEAIDRISSAGHSVTIENECGQCILSTPDEVLGFFARLDRPEKARFTWDVQNFWEMGTFPSLGIYRRLKPLIDYYHVKGGQCEVPGGPLRWRSALEDAAWPVIEITREVVADGVSPVICLNPPHGAAKEGYDGSNITLRDIEFLRREIPEIE